MTVGSSRWTRAATLGLLACTVGAARPARAGDADAILKRIDAAMSRAGDQSFEYHMVTKEPGQADRSLQFAVYIKDAWRRIDFLAPGDVKGMRILVRAIDSMYVYLPAYRKVRRVASHVKEQGFMGTAFSHDEMSLVAFAPVFTAEVQQETDLGWTLLATRREGNDFPYPKLIVEIRKDIEQPVEIQYFNNAGIKAKTETRLDFSCQKDICTPARIVMVDHTRSDLTSTLHRVKWAPNSGLSDDFFTVRALQR